MERKKTEKKKETIFCGRGRSNLKLLSSAEKIRSEMQRKGYVVVDGVLGETNSKIAEEAAMNLYESEETKFKSGRTRPGDNNRKRDDEKEGEVPRRRNHLVERG